MFTGLEREGGRAEVNLEGMRETTQSTSEDVRSPG
jgi:hypothetical protein